MSVPKRYIEKIKRFNVYRINNEINAASEKILQLAQEDEMAMTVPCIGYLSALLIVSEVRDVNRFPDSYYLCSYAGLDHQHIIHIVHYRSNITKAGSKYLRCIMLECVLAHIRNEKNI